MRDSDLRMAKASPGACRSRMARAVARCHRRARVSPCRSLCYRVGGWRPRGGSACHNSRSIERRIVPLEGRASQLDERSSWWLNIMIRLKPDQSLAAAEAALNVMRPNIREATMPPRVGARFAAQYLGEREPFMRLGASKRVQSSRF